MPLRHFVLNIGFFNLLIVSTSVVVAVMTI